MNTEVTLKAAAAHCKVSTKTLMRFIEAEYIKPVRETGDEIFVDANETCALLGVNPVGLVKRAAPVQKRADEPTTPLPSEDEKEKQKEEQVQTQTIAAESEVSQCGAREKTSEERIADKQTILAEKPEIGKQETEIDSIKTDENALIAQKAKEDIQRLENLCELQEKLLKKQDEDIEDLKIQRRWLQDRIEHLEQKADRDQILIMSHTQTIGSMMKRQSSPLQKALAWLGIEQQRDAEDDTVVEMSQVKDKAA